MEWAKDENEDQRQAWLDATTQQASDQEDTELSTDRMTALLGRGSLFVSFFPPRLLNQFGFRYFLFPSSFVVESSHRRKKRLASERVEVHQSQDEGEEEQKQAISDSPVVKRKVCDSLLLFLFG